MPDGGSFCSGDGRRGAKLSGCSGFLTAAGVRACSKNRFAVEDGARTCACNSDGRGRVDIIFTSGADLARSESPVKVPGQRYFGSAYLLCCERRCRRSSDGFCGGSGARKVNIQRKLHLPWVCVRE